MIGRLIGAGLLISISLQVGVVMAEPSVLKAEGFGTVDAAKFKGQRGKMLARRAAVVDGQRNLLETIDGVRITSGTTVRDLTLESDVIGNRVKGMLRGAFLIKENVYLDEGTWVAEVELAVCLSGGPKACQNQPTLTALMQPSLPKPAPEAMYRPTKALEVVANRQGGTKYTGMILDVTGQDFAPQLDVRVHTADGKALYGPGHVNDGTDWLHWATSMADATLMSDVIGGSPLSVVVQAIGEDSQIVVSNEDAVKIFRANLEGDDFLKSGKVILVVRP